MTRPLAIALTLLASAAGLLLLWTDVVPLGVPGEWTWGRLSYSSAGLLWGACASGIGGLIYALVAWQGDRRFGMGSKWAAAGWLVLLAAAGFGWLTAIQSAAIDGVGLSKSPHVLFYRRTEGYFWQARYDVASVPEFLAGYEDLMAEQDYLHIGTHPPGLTLLYCGLLDVCRRHPALVTAVQATLPTEVAEACEQMRNHVRTSGNEFTPTDTACLWLAVLITQATAALTVIPLYLYLRLSSPRAAAWRTVVFWPLVPAIAIFLPKSDVLYPLIGVTAAWLLRSAWFRCREKLAATAVVCGLLGGLLLVGGLVLSLAFLPVIALIGVQWLCDVVAERRDDRTGSARVLHELTMATCLTGCCLIALGGVLTLFGYNDLNLLNVWKWNFSNHALFYEHNARTYWKWLLVNPIELTLAAGVPVVALAKWGSFARLRDWRGYASSPVVPFTVVWMLLWLSGKNMGEAARLWIILQPWLVASAVNAFQSPAATAAGGERPANSEAASDTSPVGRRLWLVFLGLQLVVCALTVLRIDGFHFTELAGL